jgi:transcriptional regulator with XRE-family HTH domain
MEEVAVKLGVSYQQYSKYERAVDRISAGTLYVIAAILRVAVQHFYDGLRHDGTSDPFQETFASFDARERRLISELTNAYWRIGSPIARRGIFNMMQVIAESYPVVASPPR